jgi:glutaredoxin 3
MYSTAVCPFCLRAEMLLNSKGVTEIEKIRVDLDPRRRVEMMSKTGRRTVPQIYIGDTHVGGFEELAALEHAGKLDSLLAAQPPRPTTF